MYIENGNIYDLFFADSSLFDKEGKLEITCFGIDNKQCFCRLRGNLLLFVEINDVSISQKINELSKLPITLIILNNFFVNSSEKSNLKFCLINKRTANKQLSEQYEFTCDTNEHKNEWMNSIYLSSYKYLLDLQEKLNYSINQQCQQKHNKLIKLQVNDLNDIHDSNFAISITCDNLRSLTINDASLNFCARIFGRFRNKKWWYFLGDTEIIKSQNPQFLNSIILPNNYDLIQLKIILFNVVEKNLDIISPIAYAYFSIEQHRKAIQDQDISNKCIFYLQWKTFKLDKCVGLLKLNFFSSIINVPRIKRYFSWPYLNHISKFKSKSSNFIYHPDYRLYHKMEKQFDEPIIRKSVFNIYNNESKLIIQENMEQCRNVFDIPIQLIQSHIIDEEIILNLLKEQCELLLQCKFYTDLIKCHSNNIENCKDFIRELLKYMANNKFRASKYKKDIFLQFVPINFHKQSCLVNISNKSSTFNVYSVGAYACHYLGFSKEIKWKSLVQGQSEYSESFNILQKLFKVCHNEKKIINYIQNIVNGFNENRINHETINQLYHKVHLLSEDLLDVISIEKYESLINNINFLPGCLNYSEKFQLEPIDLIYLNIKACFVDINDKISKEQFSPNEFEPCNRKLKNALNSLRKSLLACYISSFSKICDKEIKLFEQIRFRHLTIISQCLTTIVATIGDNLNNKNFLKNIYSTKRILILHECLLSSYSDENGMLDDMTYALESISTNTSVLFNFYCSENMSISNLIDYSSEKINLVFNVYLNSEMFSIVTDKLECKIISVIFNIGINQLAPLSTNKLFQDEINQDNFKKLQSYVRNYFAEDGESMIILDSLKNELDSGKNKNIKILELACQLARRLNAIKFTCCKSAKDRTGMSITLEETRFVFNFLQLKQEIHQHLFQTILDTLRKTGTRIENVYKNIGFKKYAFSYIWLFKFPPLFRPPPGTYSSDVIIWN